MPMILRIFIFFVLSLVLFTTSFAQAQSVPRIAVLISDEGTAVDMVLDGFRAYLEAQGARADFSTYRLKNSPDIVKKTSLELHQTKVDLVLALGSLALDLATEQCPETVVIASMVINKSAIESHPNATGVSLAFNLEDQVSWLRKILPDARNIGVLYSSDENRVLMNTAHGILKNKGLNLYTEQIAEPSELPLALKKLEKNVDVIWGLSDAMVLNPKTAQTLLLFSFRNNIPFIGLSGSWVKAGALFALERDYYDIGQQCAEQALQVLSKGLKSTQISAPRKIRYSLNLRIAERFKINISKQLIEKAEKTY